jgi:hypothetical protein
LSEIRANTISDAAGTGPVTLTKQSAAKAWVNFNQTAPSVVDSFSVSSVTDVNAGVYTVNVSSTFANIGYSASGTAKGIAGVSLGRISEDHDQTRTTSSMRSVTSKTSDGAYTDFSSSSLTFHGDLA